MRVVITGHRPKSLPGGYDWTHPANRAIARWMEETLRTIQTIGAEDTGDLIAATGMALGTDQMFAVVCRKLSVPYVAFVPCANQDNVWPDNSKRLYKDILNQASEVVQVNNGPFYPACMQERNLAMRDWAFEDTESTGGPAYLMAVWTPGTKGGTTNMVHSCNSYDMDLFTFDPQGWEQFVSTQPPVQITRQFIKDHPTWLFIFGDNFERRGYGGQAAVARGEPNVIGVATKHEPTMRSGAFLTDTPECTKQMVVELSRLDWEDEHHNWEKVVRFPGIGRGLARMQETAPKLLSLIEDRLSKYEVCSGSD